MKKKKIAGIIMIVISVMAILGGIVNGSWADLGNENIITAATEVIITIGLLVGGIVLVIKSKKTEWFYNIIIH